MSRWFREPEVLEPIPLLRASAPRARVATAVVPRDAGRERDAPRPQESPLPLGAVRVGRCRVRLAGGELCAHPYPPAALGYRELGEAGGEVFVVELAGCDGEVSWLDDRSVDFVLVGEALLAPLADVRDLVRRRVEMCCRPQRGPPRALYVSWTPQRGQLVVALALTADLRSPPVAAAAPPANPE